VCAAYTHDLFAIAKLFVCLGLFLRAVCLLAGLLKQCVNFNEFYIRIGPGKRNSRLDLRVIWILYWCLECFQNSTIMAPPSEHK